MCAPVESWWTSLDWRDKRPRGRCSAHYAPDTYPEPCSLQSHDIAEAPPVRPAGDSPPSVLPAHPRISPAQHHTLSSRRSLATLSRPSRPRSLPRHLRPHPSLLPATKRLLNFLSVGTIRLEPQRGDVGRSYYLAQTSIDCIALIETPPGAEAPDGGSNSLRQWRRRESNPRPRMNPVEPLRA